MIYVEAPPAIFLVKEDLSDYVICRDGHHELQGHEYLIYRYRALQEVIAPKALAWWSE